MRLLRPFLLLSVVAMLIVPVAVYAVEINEIRIDQTSTDNDEYFELKGLPNESLNDLTFLVIGDTGHGTIEAVVPLTGQFIAADGLFLVAEATMTIGTPDYIANLNFENSDNVTHLLVSNFTGTNGMDLDTNDDCVMDVFPWTGIVDLVAMIKEDNPPVTTECHYGPPAVGPDGTFVPGHIYRCADTGTWEIGPFDILVGVDTAGTPNPACAVPVQPTTWGTLKNLYN